VSAKPFVHKHRIIYADTDQMGVAYHGRYFEWFEAARTEMLRDLGIAYHDVEASGIIMPVIEASCRYRRAIRYDEIIDIEVQVAELTKTRLKLEYIARGESGEVRASSYTLHCFVRKGRPVRIPEFLKTILSK
jgi:acyl-CoA thioester hydrolase